ncbi:hypothetical protein ACFYXH_30155 [Streptomyces sp. NPDC002730]|uniref:hypothetical protein n=1 Tax=Streptomyces sp. NPDC002730 TaxID=3364662 RepID=UPI0036C8B8F5
MIKGMVRAAAVIGVVGSAMVAVPATAQAAPEGVRTASSAAAPCPGGYWMSNSSTSARVFCDGNGPTRYQLVLACTRGKAAAGNSPWLGDRRGSYAKCPSGTTIVDKYVLIG